MSIRNIPHVVHLGAAAPLGPRVRYLVQQLDPGVDRGNGEQAGGREQLGRDVGHVALVDLQHHPIAGERRQREQRLALLDRVADRLRRVDLHHHAVERCLDPGALQALAHLVQRGLGLGQLGAQHGGAGAVVARHRLGQILFLLRLFRRLAHVLDQQVVVVQPRQQVAARDAMAGAHRGLADEAFERGRQHALHLALDAGALARRHPVRHRHHRHARQQRGAGGERSAPGAAPVNQRDSSCRRASSGAITTAIPSSWASSGASTCAAGR